jgi:PAS domain S-box-containing protein
MRKLEQYIKKGSFYQSVVEDGSDIIFIVDFNGRILYHNNSAKETLGYRRKVLIGKTFFDYLPIEHQQDFKTKFKAIQRKALTKKIEFQFRCHDKTYKFLEFNAINLKFKQNLEGFILDCRDITQRKKDAEELLRLQKAKEQFLANISHEIRTPINGIAGLATLLTNNQKAEDLNDYLTAIKYSAENLKVIINDILDLSAIESGKLKLEKIGFNLNDLLPNLISTFSHQAKEKRIDLRYTVDPTLNTILVGDPVRLNQILINLIGNAVKFTNFGHITVNAYLQSKQQNKCWVQIDVIDTGVGIPQDKLDTIFESFSQADASVTRRYGGTGLGLTIVKQLVKIQKGRIKVDSVEHQGSVFSVTIPYLLPQEENKSKTSERKTIKGIHPGKNLNILLVEDNDINRLYAKSILKNWDSEIDTAENGMVALEKVKNKHYDVVLMDIQMPIMDGYETTRAIRQMEGSQASLPIIALTANATKSDAEKCLHAGMDAFLPKPFTPEDLFQKLFYELKIKAKENSLEVNSVKKEASMFDLNYLHQVSGGNVEFIAEMVSTFIQSIPDLLQQIETENKNKNWAKVKALLHQLKPSFVLMGANTLKEEIVFAEQLPFEEDFEKNSQTLKNLLTKCRQVVSSLAESQVK